MALYFRAFVCDEDCGNLASSIPRRFGLMSLEEIGISPRTADQVIVKHARNFGCIIITRNEVDFEQAMRAAPLSCNSQYCQCGCGLVTVSARLPELPFELITRSLSINGIPIDWDIVFAANLQVSVRANGTADVTRLPMCSWERSRHADCEPCMRLAAVAPAI